MPKPNAKAASAYGVTFVTINLAEDDVKKFTAWREHNAESWTTDFAIVVSNGFKVGLTWDDANACFIASLTGKLEGTVHYNHCLTARSDDWSEALALVHFKHEVKCSGGDWTKHQTATAWG